MVNDDVAIHDEFDDDGLGDNDTVVNDDIFVDRNSLDDDNDDIVDDAHSVTIIRQVGQIKP